MAESVRLFTVQILPVARKELDRIPARQRRQIEDRIVQLSVNPRPAGCKPLQGSRFTGLYRVRSGDYRIVYQILDKRLIVIVVKIGNRKDIYR
jgi:mRNA interferase RelE/StbE